MNVVRTVALGIAGAALVSAGMIGHAILSPREAHAQATSRQITSYFKATTVMQPIAKITLSCGANGIQNVQGDYCMLEIRGVEVAPTSSATGAPASVCHIRFHSIAEGQAALGRINDPNSLSPLQCTDQSLVQNQWTLGSPKPTAAVISVDVASVTATQGFLF